jgi:hypothetical protein
MINTLQLAPRRNLIQMSSDVINTIVTVIPDTIPELITLCLEAEERHFEHLL